MRLRPGAYARLQQAAARRGQEPSEFVEAAVAWSAGGRVVATVAILEDGRWLLECLPELPVATRRALLVQVRQGHPAATLQADDDDDGSSRKTEFQLRLSEGAWARIQSFPGGSEAERFQAFWAAVEASEVFAGLVGE